MSARASLVSLGWVGVSIALMLTAAPATAKSQEQWVKAFQANDERAIARFIKRRKDPNIRGAKGYSPLMVTAARGSLEVAEQLIDLGADVNAQDDNGYTPLIWAATMGQVDVVRLLTAKGADLEKTEVHGNTALLEAAGMSEASLLAQSQLIVAHLLDAGADPNSRSKNKSTPLIAAAQRGNTANAKLLIAKGAQLDLQNDSGSTALLLAAKDGRLSAVRLLAEAGADIDLQGNNQFTPLLMAVSGAHVETTKALLSHGADVDKSGPKGITPLIYAAAKGQGELVGLLLEAGADSEGTSEDGFDALAAAKASGDQRAITLLSKGKSSVTLASAAAEKERPNRPVNRAMDPDAKTVMTLRSYRPGKTTYAQFSRDFDLSRRALSNPAGQPGSISIITHEVKHEGTNGQDMAALFNARVSGGSAPVGAASSASGVYVFGYPLKSGAAYSYASAPHNFHVVARLEFESGVLQRMLYEGIAVED